MMICYGKHIWTLKKPENFRNVTSNFCGVRLIGATPG